MNCSEITYRWRGDFSNAELNTIHAAAFDHRVFSDEEWDWVSITSRHSLGWVTARDAGALVGFVNVPWDGFVHAWIQDTVVAPTAQRQGIGVGLLAVARDEAKSAGCEWLHVDFDDHLTHFYLGAAGFTETRAGLIDLTKAE